MSWHSRLRGRKFTASVKLTGKRGSKNAKLPCKRRASRLTSWCATRSLISRRRWKQPNANWLHHQNLWQVKSWKLCWAMAHPPVIVGEAGLEPFASARVTAVIFVRNILRTLDGTFSPGPGKFECGAFQASIQRAPE